MAKKEIACLNNGSIVNAESLLPIQIDPLAALAINAQIAEQIKLLITTGTLQVGEILPPVTQLAKQLSVNHNTIAAVYSLLMELGYLMAQRGKGTFVADSIEVRQLLEDKQYLSLLSQAFAAAPHLSPSDFAGVAYAQAALQNQSHPPLKLVFVEDGLPDSLELYEQLQTDLRLSLEFLDCRLLEARQSAVIEQLLAADLIVTTSAQAWQVTQQSRPTQELVVIDARPSPELLTRLASLSRGAQLLLVGDELAESERMKQLLLNAGIIHLELHTTDLKQLQLQQEQFTQVDGICLSRRAKPHLTLLEQITPLVLMFSSSIDAANLLILKARINLLRSGTFSR